MTMSRPSRPPLLLAILLATLTALLPATAAAGPPRRESTPVQTWLPMVVGGTGELRGHIIGTPAAWPREPIGVWLASYWPLSEDERSGLYVFDPTTDPRAMLDADGTFAFTHVAAGRYCLIIGITPLHMTPVRNEYGRAEVFRVEAGATLDVGTVVIW